MKYTLAVIAVLFSFSSVRAQDSTRHWKNAIGVTGSGLSYLFGTDRLMIEPGIGVYYSSPSRYLSPSFGLGLYRWGRVTPDLRWYAGPRIGATVDVARRYDVAYAWPDASLNVPTTYWDLTTSLSAVLGVEQRVSDHFSVGAETGAEWLLINAASNRDLQKFSIVSLLRSFTARYYF